MQELLCHSKVSNISAKHIAQFAWGKSTVEKQNSVVRNWIKFCKMQKRSEFSFKIKSMLGFLEYMSIERKYSYRSLQQCKRFLINARKLSAKPFNPGEDKQIEKFMQALFNRAPPVPNKPMGTWDVNILLNHFVSLGDNLQMTSNELAGKMVSLLLLTKMCRMAEVMTLKSGFPPTLENLEK